MADNGFISIDVNPLEILPDDKIDQWIADVGKSLGIDSVLRRMNNEPEPEGTSKDQQEPDFWTNNKKWLQPTLIGGGALLTLILIVTATQGKKKSK